MNKNTKIIIGFIALAIVAGGIYTSTNSKDVSMIKKEQAEKNVMEEKNVMMKAEDTKVDSMIKKEETSMLDKGDTMMKVGSYETYSADKIAQAENGDVVLFFHASWCPSCRGLNSNIEKNIKSIPQGVSILKTDYDKETELKKKYGVTYQHTLVQVDKDGNMIKKWSGGGSLEGLLSQIQ